MIQGTEYAWEDVQFVVTGKSTPMTGITAIDYGTERVVDYLYGKGAEPLQIKKGNKSYMVSFTVLQSEFEALQAAIPQGKDVTDIILTGTISYAPAGGKVVTDQILNFAIEKFSKPFKSGDGNMEVAMTGKAVKINYNV